MKVARLLYFAIIPYHQQYHIQTVSGSSLLSNGYPNLLPFSIVDGEIQLHPIYTYMVQFFSKNTINNVSMVVMLPFRLEATLMTFI
jgi:hypothetical protein